MANTYTKNMGLLLQDPSSTVNVQSFLNANFQKSDDAYGGVPLFASEADRDSTFDVNSRNFIFCVVGSNYATGLLYFRYKDSWVDFNALTGTSLNIKGSVANAAALPSGAANGDCYVTLDNGHLNVWNASQWVDLGHIQGPVGPGIIIKGAQPTVGDLPSSGNAIGDAWVVDADNHLYSWDGGQWNDAGQFKGDKGDTGSPGSRILSGTVDPTGSDGVDSDWYFNTVTKTMFGPKTSGSWSPGTLLKGDKGNTGNGLMINGVTNVIGNLPNPPAEGSGAVYFVSGTGHLYVYNGASWDDIGLWAGTVRTINGISPDANGNVEIKVQSGFKSIFMLGGM